MTAMSPVEQIRNEIFIALEAALLTQQTLVNNSKAYGLHKNTEIYAAKAEAIFDLGAQINAIFANHQPVNFNADASRFNYKSSHLDIGALSEDHPSPGMAAFDAECPTMSHFQKYIDYINNTGLEPLPISSFDDDWGAIGPRVRDDMAKAGIIQVRKDGIYLRPDLISRENLEHWSSDPLKCNPPNSFQA